MALLATWALSGMAICTPFGGGAKSGYCTEQYQMFGLPSTRGVHFPVHIRSIVYMPNLTTDPEDNITLHMQHICCRNVWDCPRGVCRNPCAWSRNHPIQIYGNYFGTDIFASSLLNVINPPHWFIGFSTSAFLCCLCEPSYVTGRFLYDGIKMQEAVIPVGSNLW